MTSCAQKTLAGVWSATPTPLTAEMTVDVQSVERLVAHHIRLGVKGLFLAGTCGEGAWMPERERETLVRTVTQVAGDALAVAVQVTDNSAARILDNIHAAQKAGADIAVIAPPYFLLNATPENIIALYTDAIAQSPLPIGVYDRGAGGAVEIPDEVLEPIYSQENVTLVKDSSQSPQRRDIALAVREQRPEVLLFNGDEFNCVEYLQAGYDGLLLGGGIFNGYLAGQIIEAVGAGDLPLAEELQSRMIEMMYAVYGGKEITCWLSGLKKLLVEMGIFSTWRNFLNYPLTAECEEAIAGVLERDSDVLFP